MWLPNYCALDLGFTSGFTLNALFILGLLHTNRKRGFDYTFSGFCTCDEYLFHTCSSLASKLELAIMVSVYNFTTLKTIGKLYVLSS